MPDLFYLYKLASDILCGMQDYVHVTNAYWSLYRVARNYPNLTSTSWEWRVIHDNVYALS